MRLTNLQALRGVACLLVLFFHVAEWELHRCESPAVRVAAPFEYFGYAGVDLFFVLSGFVITWVSFGKLGDRSQLLSFAWRRAWRIFPLYSARCGLDCPGRLSGTSNVCLIRSSSSSFSAVLPRWPFATAGGLAGGGLH